MAVSIHNPNEWRSIKRKTCFNCKFRVWARNSESGNTYCGLEPTVPMGKGNLRPSRWICNLWREWKGNNAK